MHLASFQWASEEHAQSCSSSTVTCWNYTFVLSTIKEPVCVLLHIAILHVAVSLSNAQWDLSPYKLQHILFQKDDIASGNADIICVTWQFSE